MTLVSLRRSLALFVGNRWQVSRSMAAAGVATAYRIPDRELASYGQRDLGSPRLFARRVALGRPPAHCRSYAGWDDMPGQGVYGIVLAKA